MNGDGRANPSAAFTASREKANRIPGAGTGPRTEPISCEYGAGGGDAQSFKPAAVGEEQLCSRCDPRWCCPVSAGGAQQISLLLPRLGAVARSRLKTIFLFRGEGIACGGVWVLQASDQNRGFWWEGRDLRGGAFGLGELVKEMMMVSWAQR